VKVCKRERLVATFSIVAYDSTNGDLGVAVQSKFLAVGAVVPWARAGVGAVATQSWANTTYGPEGLRLMAEGLTAQEALKKLIEADEERDRRQVGVADARGNAAAYTGQGCFDWAGHIVREGFACQGNILVSEETVQAMAQTFSVQVTDPLILPIRVLATGKSTWVADSRAAPGPLRCRAPPPAPARARSLP